jgi:hypothetical protein
MKSVANTQVCASVRRTKESTHRRIGGEEAFYDASRPLTGEAFLTTIADDRRDP